MAARNRVAATVRIQLQAGAASPGKVGQALGVHGINIVAFLAAYNRASAAQRGLVVPVVVTVYDDRSFDLELRTPPTSACWPGRPASPGAAAAPAPTPLSPSLPATSYARSPGPSSPTSTPPTWTPPSGSWPAPPAPWGSTWSTSNEPLKGPHRDTTAAARSRRGGGWQARDGRRLAADTVAAAD
jgi:Ribosomal protein L11, N-terminal domain